MRAALVILLSILATQARADITVVSPAMMRFGVIALGDAYKREWGTAVTVNPQSIGLIPKLAATATPAPDIVILPPDLMETMAKDKAILPESRTSLGRMQIGLAVRPGTPHPDISTVEKLRAALNGKTVVFTRPGRGSMEAGIIEKLLQRPEFAGVKTLTVTDVSGVTALARGDGDLGIQAVSAINGQKGIELVAPLPRELNAHIDMEIAALSRSPDPARAREFVRYLTRPEAAAEWEKIGLDR